ncbi:hypothetical protein D3C81_934310 [compost metagenome]
MKPHSCIELRIGVKRILANWYTSPYLPNINFITPFSFYRCHKLKIIPKLVITTRLTVYCCWHYNYIEQQKAG